MTEEKETIDYPRGLTFEQVWAGIQELGKKYDAIFEREAKEREERQEREAKERQEREEREAKERQEREEREAKERQEREERQKVVEERLKKLDAFVEKTNRSVGEMNGKVGNLDHRFGELIEHLVAPGIAQRFNQLGYHFDDVTHPFSRKYKKNGIVIAQVDVLLENQDARLIIEVKAKPNLDDIQKLLGKMEIIRQYYCEQEPVPPHKKLIGALAGAIFPKNIKQFAIENGFYVITQSGDTVKIDVPEDFKPRIF
jgi:hypothetical protein